MMTFEELGAFLRSEREKKNLNITDVANQLKINPRQLRAIEDGDVGSLPHPAYVRGFIRSYATLLGLGSDEIQEILDSVLSLSAARPKKKIEKQPSPDVEGVKSSHGGWKFLIFLVALAAALYYLWDAGYLDFVKQWGSGEKTEVSELQRADTYMAAKDAEKSRRESMPSLTPPPVQEDSAERMLPLGGNQPIPAPPVAESRPILPDVKAKQEKVTTTPVEEAAPAVPEAVAEASSAGHKLIITAVEECWIHSNADKTDTRQFSLRKGDTFALTFADSLELKLGNAGGVRLRYDGNDLPPPGASGQVRTITFPPSNS